MVWVLPFPFQAKELWKTKTLLDERCQLPNSTALLAENLAGPVNKARKGMKRAYVQKPERQRKEWETMGGSKNASSRSQQTNYTISHMCPGCTDDDLSSNGRHSHFHSGIAVFSQSASQEFVEFSIEDTYADQKCFKWRRTQTHIDNTEWKCWIDGRLMQFQCGSWCSTTNLAKKNAVKKPSATNFLFLETWDWLMACRQGRRLSSLWWPICGFEPQCPGRKHYLKTTLHAPAARFCAL